MPGFSFPGRPGGEYDEPWLDMIFDGRAIPPDAPAELHDLTRLLAAAAGPAEPGELAGEAAARAAFLRLPSPARVSPAGVSPARVFPAGAAAQRPARHRASRRPAQRRVGLAAALSAAAAAAVCTAAAYVGVLPGPVQQMAHVTVGAPAPHRASFPAPSTPRPRQDTRPAAGPARPAARQPALSSGATQSHRQAAAATPRGQLAKLPGGPGPGCGPGPWIPQYMPVPGEHGYPPRQQPVRYCPAEPPAQRVLPP